MVKKKTKKKTATKKKSNKKSLDPTKQVINDFENIDKNIGDKMKKIVDEVTKGDMAF